VPTNPPHLRPPELPLHETLQTYADVKKARGETVFCIQIGANDGKTNDPVHRYLTGYGWRGLLVEPLVDVFEQDLKKTYANYSNVTLVNVALAPTDGSLPLYRVAVSRARWATGLSSFRRENLENHIANGYIEKKAKAEGVAMPSDPNDVIEVVQVPTMTVVALLKENKVDQFDVLCIDTEGFDFEVLKLFDFKTHRPDFVLFESKNLADDDYVAAKTMLGDAGYRLYWHNGDTFAVHQGTAGEIASEKMRAPLRVALRQARSFARKVKGRLRARA
jgi:FkbM family methyltransferase